MSTPFLANAIIEKLAEKFFRQFPVLAVDTIFYLGRFHLTLYQSGFLQLLEVLGNGGLGYRQFLVDAPETTILPLGKELEYRNACRMPHSLGETSHLLLFKGIIFIRHTLSLLIVRKITNNILF